MLDGITSDHAMCGMPTTSSNNSGSSLSTVSATTSRAPVLTPVIFTPAIKANSAMRASARGSG